jgi:hypothetical protein
MQQRLSAICDEFSLFARMFRLATWAVADASCLLRRTGILACPVTSRRGSLHDVSGWKPKLR